MAGALATIWATSYREAKSSKRPGSLRTVGTASALDCLLPAFFMKDKVLFKPLLGRERGGDSVIHS